MLKKRIALFVCMLSVATVGFGMDHNPQNRRDPQNPRNLAKYGCSPSGLFAPQPLFSCSPTAKEKVTQCCFFSGLVIAAHSLTNHNPFEYSIGLLMAVPAGVKLWFKSESEHEKQD